MKRYHEQGGAGPSGSQSNDNPDWHRDRLTAGQREVLRRDAARLQLLRNLRRQEFDSAILGEPAWDILLALFVIDNDKRRMNVGELAKATHVPLTTALRWVAALEERDLAWRRPHPFDQRVVQIELTENGRRTMESFFMHVREAEALR